MIFRCVLLIALVLTFPVLAAFDDLKTPSVVRKIFAVAKAERCAEINQGISGFYQADTIVGYIKRCDPAKTTLVLDLDDTVFRDGHAVATEKELVEQLINFQKKGGELLFETYRSFKHHEFTLNQLTKLGITPSPILRGRQIIVDPMDGERCYFYGILYCNQSHVHQGGKRLKGHWLTELFKYMPEQKARHIAFFDDMSKTAEDVYLKLSAEGYNIQSFDLAPVSGSPLPWWLKRDIINVQALEPIPGNRHHALERYITIRMLKQGYSINERITPKVKPQKKVPQKQAVVRMPQKVIPQVVAKQNNVAKSKVVKNATAANAKAVVKKKKSLVKKLVKKKPQKKKIIKAAKKKLKGLKTSEKKKPLKKVKSI